MSSFDFGFVFIFCEVQAHKQLHCALPVTEQFANYVVWCYFLSAIFMSPEH